MEAQNHYLQKDTLEHLYFGKSLSNSTQSNQSVPLQNLLCFINYNLQMENTLLIKENYSKNIELSHQIQECNLINPPQPVLKPCNTTPDFMDDFSLSSNQSSDQVFEDQNFMNFPQEFLRQKRQLNARSRPLYQSDSYNMKKYHQSSKRSHLKVRLQEEMTHHLISNFLDRGDRIVKKKVKFNE